MATTDIEDAGSREVTEICIQDAGEHASDAWKDAAMASIEAVAREKERFSAVDVWQRFRESYGEFADTGTHRLCAMGAVFRRAAFEGIMRRSGDYVNGPSGGVGSGGHTKCLPVWESQIYGVARSMAAAMAGKPSTATAARARQAPPRAASPAAKTYCRRCIRLRPVDPDTILCTECEDWVNRLLPSKGAK